MTHPAQVKSADYLILESTYGNRQYPNIDVLTQLEEIINSTFTSSGTVVIPAFAVGRTQILLYYIYKLNQEKRLSHHIPIYLDSPMAQDVTTLWNHYSGEHRLSNEECSKVCSVAEYVQSRSSLLKALMSEHDPGLKMNSISIPSVVTIIWTFTP